MGHVFLPLLRLKGFCLNVLHSRFLRWTKPLTPSLLLETLADLGRSKSQLIAENALLRQQLIILHRQVQRPAWVLPHTVVDNSDFSPNRLTGL
jgi:putative transposase